MFTEVFETIPLPPTDITMPQAAERIFTALGSIPLIALVILAIQHLRTGRGPLLLLCLLGGLAASAYEPFVDVLGLVYLPENGALGTFTFLDRQMPLFVPLIYPWYVGGLAYLAYRLYERGISRRGIFLLWIGGACVDYLLELPAVLTKVYSYYGDPPFNFWGHPMWWGFMHSLVALAGGAAIYLLRDTVLRGWGILLTVPLLFMIDGMVNAGAGWPLYVALNSGNGLPVTYPAALLTLALAGILVWIIAVVLGRSLRQTTASAADEDDENASQAQSTMPLS